MDVNVLMKSKNGWMTPLDVCLVKGHRSCAKFILLHGALPASKLPDGLVLIVFCRDLRFLFAQVRRPLFE